MQQNSNKTTSNSENDFDNISQNKIDKEIVLKIFKACLGEIDLYKIKNFFLDLVQRCEPYDVKDVVIIFATRRCHVLFYLFYNFIFAADEKKHFNQVAIISDKAVELNSEKLKGKYCKIVDDILIHGRSLSNIQKRVVDAQPARILKYVYALNDSDNDNITKTDYYSISIKNDDWENLSNNIVSLIILMSTPYTSYIYSWDREMSEEEFDNILNKFRSNDGQYMFGECCLDLSLNENKDDAQIKQIISDNIVARVFFYNGTDKRFENLTPCIRLYYNKLLKKCLLIPFCFLGPLSQDNINNYIDKICDLNSFDSFKNNIKKAKIQTKYRLIQTIFSYAFGSIFFDNYEGWNSLNEQIDASYFEDFYNSALVGNVKSFLEEDICKAILAHEYNVYRKHSIEDILTEDPYSLSFRNNVYMDTLIDKIQEKKNEPYSDCNIENYINEYQSQVHINEETGYREGRYSNKQIGIPMSFLKTSISIVADETKTDFEFYKYIIQSMDTGLFALYPEKISDCSLNRCEEYLTTGEQVCRLLNIPNNVLLRDVTELLINRKRLSQKNTKSDYLNTVLAFIENNGGDGRLINSLEKSYKNFPQPRMILSLVQGTQNNEKLRRIYINGLENV